MHHTIRDMPTEAMFLRLLQACPMIVQPLPGAVLAPGESIRGTGRPGQLLHINIDGSLYPARVNPQGDWSVRPEVSAGQHMIRIQLAGCPPLEQFFTVNIGSVPPPTITNPAEGQSVPSKRPLFDGRGIPGSRVQICLPSINLCVNTMVNDRGYWAASSPRDLPEGANTAIITQFEGDGRSSSPIDLHFSVGNPTVYVPPPTGIQPPDGAVVSSPWQIISGDGVPRYSVQVCFTQLQWCSRVNVSNAGRWSIRPPRPLPSGTNQLVLTQYAQDGSSSAPVTTTIEVEG